MAKNNKNSTKRTTGNNDKYLSDYLAVVPSLLMLLMIALMLILDISLPQMADKQYEDFPAIFRVMNYVAVLSGAAYLITLILRKESQMRWSYAFFAGFLACIALSTAVNGLTDEAIHGVPYRNIGIFNMAAFIIIYMMSASLIRRDQFKDFILLVYIAIADLIAAVVFVDKYVSAIPAFGAKKELSAIFFNGNHYGYYLVMAVLIGTGYYLLSDGWRTTVGGISALLNLMILAINHTLGCILAVSAVILVVCICTVVKLPNNRRRVLILVGTIGLLAAIALIISPELRTEITTFSEDLSSIIGGSASGSAGHGRLKIWRLTAEFISEKPLLGHGCEGISMRMYAETAISNPHNELLTYAAYYGIPAAALYALGVLSTIAESLRAKSGTSSCDRIACMAAAGYFISSIVGVAMFYTLPFFFLFLGMSSNATNCNNKH